MTQLEQESTAFLSRVERRMSRPLDSRDREVCAATFQAGFQTALSSGINGLRDEFGDLEPELFLRFLAYLGSLGSREAQL